MKESNLKIILADKEDAARLSKISFAAKAHWGYPKDWLAIWKPNLTIRPEDFEVFTIFKLVEATNIIGFMAIDCRPNELEIEHLWIRPERIGQGFGKLLLNYGIQQTCNDATEQILVVADPNAAGFYQKMGFETFKFVKSKPGNRRLPVMKRPILV